MNDFLIVGAGWLGAIVAYILSLKYCVLYSLTGENILANLSMSFCDNS